MVYGHKRTLNHKATATRSYPLRVESKQSWNYNVHKCTMQSCTSHQTCVNCLAPNQWRQSYGLDIFVIVMIVITLIISSGTLWRWIVIGIITDVDHRSHGWDQRSEQPVQVISQNCVHVVLFILHHSHQTLEPKTREGVLVCACWCVRVDVCGVMCAGWFVRVGVCRVVYVDKSA